MLKDLRQDLRYGLRMLRRSPALAATAVASLGLGIGATVSMFIVVNAALLRPLPVDSPEELVFLFTGSRENPYGPLSYPDYLDYRDAGPVFRGLAAYGEIAVSLSVEETPELVRGVIASGNFFEVLGVRGALGRTLTPNDDQSPGEHPVVVLSHGLWRRRFGGDPETVGRTVSLNGRPYGVVGILPPGFRGPDALESYDLYVPMMMQAYVRPPRAGFSGEMDPDLLNRRRAGWLRGIGRLMPGITEQQAQAAVATLASQLEQAYPDQPGGRIVTLFPLSKIDPRAYPLLRAVATLLLAVAGVVLLVATVNVTNLLLARTISRGRELALRRALGGSRGRLIRQLLAEGLLLASLGGALGLAVASWSIDGLERLTPATGMFSFTLDFHVDARVLLFTFMVSLLSAILGGLAPALRATAGDLAPALKDPAGASETGSWRLPGRRVLVLAQVSMSMMLLIGAGLFLKSFSQARRIDPGFATEELLTANLRLDLLRYTKAQGQRFYREIVERVQALPRVRAASVARIVPLAGGARTTSFELLESSAPASDGPLFVQTNVVGFDYFRTMGIGLLQGRDFSEGDVEGSPRVVIVNETFVRRYFPSSEARGKRIRLGADEPWREIVGVARDSKYRTLGEEPAPHVYQPLGQQYETGMVLLVRTTGDPGLVLADVRSLLLAMEPYLPIVGLEPLSSLSASSLFPARMGAGLLTAFASLALTLAALGLYGLTAFAVSRRTREMGIRVALGARPGELIRLVVGEGLALVGAGVLLGSLGAVFATRFVTSFLYGVSPTDPTTFGSIALLLTLVMLAATYLPARRAARSDPLVALRYE